VHNYVGKERHTVRSDVVVGPGPHELALSFHSNGDFSGSGRLLVDGANVGEGPIAMTTPVRHSISGAGLTCGWEQGPPVGEGYSAPFRFSGALHRVVVEVAGLAHRDPDAEFEAIMAEQ
jgi:arylsulfatase